MIRWIADDKNCEPRKKTSVKSVVRKSQVTGDVCPENIHLRSLLMARSNTHTHTHTQTHHPFQGSWPFPRGGRTFVFTKVYTCSKAHPRTSIVGTTQNFQVILNICQTGAAKRWKEERWAGGGMFEGERGRPMYEFHGGPREMELRVLAEILCLSLARNIRALSRKRYGET